MFASLPKYKGAFLVIMSSEVAVLVAENGHTACPNLMVCL
jgi:hypothetical protein